MFPDWLIWIVLFLLASLAFLFVLSLPHTVEHQQSFDVKFEHLSFIQILSMDILYFVVLVFNAVKSGFVNLIRILYHSIIDMTIRHAITDEQTFKHSQEFTDNRSLIKHLSKRSHTRMNCIIDTKTILSKNPQQHILESS